MRARIEAEVLLTVVAPEFDALDFNFLVKVDGLDLGHAVLQVGFVVQHIISTYVATKVSLSKRSVLTGSFK